jgi:hypothetical protein
MRGPDPGICTVRYGAGILFMENTYDYRENIAAGAGEWQEKGKDPDIEGPRKAYGVLCSWSCTRLR